MVTKIEAISANLLIFLSSHNVYNVTTANKIETECIPSVFCLLDRAQYAKKKKKKK